MIRTLKIKLLLISFSMLQAWQVQAQTMAQLELSGSNLVVHRIQKNESLDSLKSKFKTNIQRLSYLMDIYNRPLMEGDVISLVELRTADQDAFFYPSYIKIDYSGGRFEKNEMAGIVTEANNKKRYTVSYYLRNGNKIGTLWVSRTSPGDQDNIGLYDVELYPFRMPMEAPLLDTNLPLFSGAYGERVNPFLNIAEEFHYGTDFRLDVGTPLYAPYSGTMTIGYGRRSSTEEDPNTADLGYGKFMYMESAYTYRTDASENRRKKTIQLAFMFGHLSNYPDNIRKDLITDKLSKKGYSEARYKELDDWYNMLLSSTNEKSILKELRRWDIRTLGTGRKDIKQGDLIAYSGNTGRSTGPHLHLEVIINGAHVDPMVFFKANGLKTGVDSLIVAPIILNAEARIKDQLQSKLPYRMPWQ